MGNKTDDPKAGSVGGHSLRVVPDRPRRTLLELRSEKVTQWGPVTAWEWASVLLLLLWVAATIAGVLYSLDSQGL